MTHSRNCPPASSPASFSHTIILLKLPYANPPTPNSPITEDYSFSKSSTHATLKNSLPDQYRSPDCFSKPSSRFFVCEYAQVNRSGPFLFETPPNAAIRRGGRYSPWRLRLRPPGLAAAMNRSCGASETCRRRRDSPWRLGRLWLCLIWDLLSLDLSLAAPADLGATSIEAACQFGCVPGAVFSILLCYAVRSDDDYRLAALSLRWASSLSY